MTLCFVLHQALLGFDICEGQKTANAKCPVLAGGSISGRAGKVTLIT
jgi:hypothetical protein